MTTEPAAGRAKFADRCTRVYTWKGRTAHLLAPGEAITAGHTMCPVLPSWPDAWRGTGSQAETELAARLPTCKRCEARAAAEDGYYAEASQFRAAGIAP